MQQRTTIHEVFETVYQQKDVFMETVKNVPSLNTATKTWRDRMDNMAVDKREFRCELKTV